MFDASDIERVRTAADIATVATAAGVKLRPAGRLLEACCPFHAEKTPSFKIDPERHTWRCYGACATGGDAIDLYMRLNRMEFTDAVRALAQASNITLSENDPAVAAAAAKARDERKGLEWVNTEAAHLWQAALDTPGNAGLNYLRERGFTQNTLHKFGVGFAAPDGALLREALHARLAAGGRNTADGREKLHALLRASGLTGERDGTEYERFRGRVIIPLRDTHGTIAGFAGRLIKENKRAGKYVNSPESAIFHKREFLFGIDVALPAIRQERKALLVEGQLDVMALHQAGIGFAIGTSGTSLPRAVFRLAAEIILGYDADSAGQKATYAAGKELFAAGLAFKVACPPIETKDWCGCIMQRDPDRPDCGRSLAALAIEEAKDGVEWLYAHLENLPVNERAAELGALIASTADPVLRDLRRAEIAARFALSPEAVAGLTPAPAHPQATPPAPTPAGAANKNAGDKTPVSDAEGNQGGAGDGLELNDLGNAMRVFARHGADVRYCAGVEKWLVWTGRHWSWDEEPLIRGVWWREVTDALATEAKTSMDRQFRKFARDCGNFARENGMLNKLKSIPGVPVTMNDLDTNEDYLPVQNGVIDLTNGSLLPATAAREAMCTRVIEHDYEPAARSEIWEKFIRDITMNDQELAQYIQRCAGYSLTASIKEQCLFFLYGEGRNGKSTFVEALYNMMGEFAHKSPIEMLTKNFFARDIPTHVADLQGRRMTSCSEIPSGMFLDEGRVKDLTGDKVISARRMAQDFIKFRSTCKLWLFGNHEPQVGDTDQGIWRRIRRLPLKANFRDEDIDKDLGRKLESPDNVRAILAWAVAGCLQWREHGLGEPECVRAETLQYRQQQDRVGNFVRECCYLGAQTFETPSFSEINEIPTKDLYKAYVTWATDDEGIKRYSHRRFAEDLLKIEYAPEHHICREHTRNGSVYRGISLDLDGDKKNKAASFGCFAPSV